MREMNHIETTFIREQSAAALLGLSKRTLQKFRVTGYGPAFHKFGSCVRYSVADLEKWTESCRHNSTSNASQGGVQ
ncbi:MAG: helix-turn-helix domain-containing protein [Alphaproteobacteria bacterium]|nr:helix-turn-helix domain-containing protein [Alphaproteobacteria bacterium]MBT4082994.1 helix-turn-helix domain-containing protein [Alphaproteobacteria bacterium]